MSLVLHQLFNLACLHVVQADKIIKNELVATARAGREGLGVRIRQAGVPQQVLGGPISEPRQGERLADERNNSNKPPGAASRYSKAHRRHLSSKESRGELWRRLAPIHQR